MSTLPGAEINLEHASREYLIERIGALEAENARLTAALEFYSISKHYPLAIMEVRHFKAVIDGGEKARNALAARAAKEQR